MVARKVIRGETACWARGIDKRFRVHPKFCFMPYIPIKPSHMERYLRGDSIYLGPTMPVNYRVMSTRVNPYSGEMEITGMREEQGQFPVLPSLLAQWALAGLWNWFSGWFLSLFGVKRENNPLRLQFHYGYALREDAPPGGYGGSDNGRNRANGRNGYSGNGWENGLARELYGLD